VRDSGDGEARPLIETPFSECGARLSPDGRAIAHVSTESGRPEVYIRTFPALEGKTQVSTNGVSQPVWSRRGGEPYFTTPEDKMAASVQVGATLAVGQPRKLFDFRFHLKGVTHTGYDVARDGRFLMVKQKQTGDVVAADHLLVVLNWFEELKERLR
jgi:eukaryotic-like serine/threonine-protein kinase